MSINRWKEGGCSVREVLVLKARGPEFNPQLLHISPGVCLWLSPGVVNIGGSLSVTGQSAWPNRWVLGPYFNNRVNHGKQHLWLLTSGLHAYQAYTHVSIYMQAKHSYTYKYLYFFSIYEHFASVFVLVLYGHTEAKKRQQNPWDWYHRQLWAALYMLGTWTLILCKNIKCLNW